MSGHSQAVPSPLLFQCNHAASVTVLQAEFWKAKAARLEAGEEAGEDHVMLFDDEPSYSAKEVTPHRPETRCACTRTVALAEPRVHGLRPFPRIIMHCACLCSRWPL